VAGGRGGVHVGLAAPLWAGSRGPPIGGGSGEAAKVNQIANPLTGMTANT